jgi:hypothetical protein
MVTGLYFTLKRPRSVLSVITFAVPQTPVEGAQ